MDIDLVQDIRYIYRGIAFLKLANLKQLAITRNVEIELVNTVKYAHGKGNGNYTNTNRCIQE